MDQAVLTLLREAREIAVVGISAKPDRPSHEVAAFLQSRGYRIVPVNPGLQEVLGERCYPSLAAYGKPVDIVDVFRAPEAVPPIVDEAIAAGAKCVWMQEGVSHADAAAKARAAGLLVVEDRCILKALVASGIGP